MGTKTVRALKIY